MAREHRSNEASQQTEVAAEVAPDASSSSSTRFATTGTIPPVATTTAGSAPTASERAFGQAPSTFTRAMDFILPHEEVYAKGHYGDENHVVAEHVKGDPGGTTKYGIDQASHPKADIENLTRDQALAIYRKEWDHMHLDGLPDQVAMTLFDVRVNGGDPIRWMQHAINELQGPDAQKLKPDGKMGPATIAAAKSVDAAALAQGIIAQRAQYYDRLATDNPKRFGPFLEGWQNRNHDLSAYVARPPAEQTRKP